MKIISNFVAWKQESILINKIINNMNELNDKIILIVFENNSTIKFNLNYLTDNVKKDLINEMWN